MECYSPLFRDTVLRLPDADQPFIATIGKKETPLTEDIKKRSDVKLFEVTIENQEWIREELPAAGRVMGK
jgi:nucleoside-triphosphatase THEP1